MKSHIVLSKFKINLLLLSTFWFIPYCISQNETNYWFFGDGAGLDFSSGSPVAITTGQSYSLEGTSAASDPVTGALLFYSNGLDVWDATHSLMPNGTGLMGNTSSSMGALIVPQPGHNNLFYLFTVDAYQNNGANGFRYNVVDMNANGGKGDVVSKNNLLFAPCNEINHAVKHANCTDYWIIARSALGNTYYTYLLSSAGLSAPVINLFMGISANGPGWGQGKFSPDGKKFAAAHSNFMGDHSFELFDFDNTTGILSNPLTLDNVEGGYGVSFSADNTKLYATLGPYSETLYQWDLSSGMPATIISSQYAISALFTGAELQLGRDYKIYLADYGSLIIPAINNPNSLGAACNYGSSYAIASDSCRFGLPAFPENYFNELAPAPIIANGNTLTVTFGNAVQLFSSGTGTPEWSPPSGLSCTTCPNPFASPVETTTYVVTYDNNGLSCPTSQSITIYVEYKPVIPNVFTPNGDGTNDVFLISGLPPSRNKLTIYNRWGNIGYETPEYPNNWKTCVDGVYYYILELDDGGRYNGFVQVLAH